MKWLELIFEFLSEISWPVSLLVMLVLIRKYIKEGFDAARKQKADKRK